MRPTEPVTILPALAPPAALDTFEEERREILHSVFEALCCHPPNSDEMAACSYLVRHLAVPDADRVA